MLEKVCNSDFFIFKRILTLLFCLDKIGKTVYNNNKRLNNCSTVIRKKEKEMQRTSKTKAPDCCPHEVHTSLVAAARERMPECEVTYDLSDFFKVLGDSTRLSILFAIDASPMCVCDIAEAVGMTKSAVSHQLKVLRQNDLVRYTKSGKNVIYSLADDHVRDIIERALEHIKE